MIRSEPSDQLATFVVLARGLWPMLMYEPPLFDDFDFV
jgi:nitrate reductase NapE component